VASVSGSHTDIPPELRQLAQTILDKLDPAVRLAAARALTGSASRCEQVWCPVCALGALISGEQHPLLTVVAEHSVALLDVVRAMSDPAPASGPPDPPDPAHPEGPPPDDDPSPPSGPGHYQHIPVTVTRTDE
jgi:hypothetical protein